jgi:hypothetical protein
VVTLCMKHFSSRTTYALQGGVGVRGLISDSGTRLGSIIQWKDVPRPLDLESSWRAWAFLSKRS